MALSTSHLIIFDCDGVLVDSEPLANRVLVDMMTEAGWAMSEDESQKRFRGRRMDDVMADITGHTGKSLPDTWLPDFEKRRNALFREALKPIPGVADVLTRLTALSTPICVASSGSVAKSRFTLGMTGLAGFFGDRIYSSWGLPNGKPAPDIFLHAAQDMGFTPSACTVIEDSLPGVTTAQAAKMRCLGYAADSDPKVLAGAGAVCFTDMAQLPRLLGLPDAA